jgi:cysteine desulfurase/selenocysteine lyase
MRSFKGDFPIFKNNPELVYLDSAATTQKPKAVVDAVTNFYQRYNANIYRGIYDLSQHATELFEQVRETVCSFIDGKDPSEVIFTSGATEGINLAANGWAKKYLQRGDIIVLSEMEHHSNIVPWLRLKEEMGIEIVFPPITVDFRLDYETILQTIDVKKIKLVALTQVSNVLGTINPIKEIISFFKTQNADIKFLVDAAQSAAHLPISVDDLGCDFLVFSSHKVFGPSGVGVLWSKKELLEAMDPLLLGSHMIQTVTKDRYTLAAIPDRFESGTRNLEGVIGLGAAIDYVKGIGFLAIQNHERKLTEYLLERLEQQSGIHLFGLKTNEDRLSVFSFAMTGIHPHDVAEILNRDHIAVRAGHHCAQPLMDVLGVSGTVRVSMSVYNSREDVDKFFEAVTGVKSIFKR